MKKKRLIAMPVLTALISVGLLNLQPAIIEAHTNYAQKPAQVRGERKSKVRKNKAKAKITRRNSTRRQKADIPYTLGTSSPVEVKLGDSKPPMSPPKPKTGRIVVGRGN